MHYKAIAIFMTFTITASLLLLIDTTHSAFACSCIQPRSPTEELNASSAVFSGQVVDIAKTSGREYTVIFAIEKSWKGISGKTVNVLTGLGGGDCGYGFKIGEKYLVYTYGSVGNLNTSICSRTKPLADAQEDLKVLGAEWKIYKLSVKDQVFKVPYSVTNVQVTKMYVGDTFDSLLIAMASDANHNGTVQVTVPRNLIDLKRTDGTDDIFTVLIDGKEISNVEEINSSPCFRTLSIPFDAGTKKIEIIAATFPENTTPRRSDVAPIYVTTDKDHYETGSPVRVSGCTSLALDDKMVILEVQNPDAKVFKTMSMSPNTDGAFFASFVVRGDLAMNGTYTVKATYAGQSTTNSLVVPEFPVNSMVIAVVGLFVLLAFLRLKRTKVLQSTQE